MAATVKHSGWRKILIVILALEVAYVAAELAFNAAILNVVSGSLGATVDVDYLFLKGKQLSGIGLGLLIFSFVALQRPSPPHPGKALLGAAFLFPACIWAMTTFQTWLINDPLVNSASNEELVAAHYLQNAVPAIRDGLVEFKDAPIESGDLSRPETKAFLSLIGPTLLHNEDAVAKVVSSAHDLIKNRAQQEAIASSEALYEVYQEQLGPDSVSALYEAYMRGSYRYTNDLQRRLATIDGAWDREVRVARDRLARAWGRYKNYHRWDGNMYSDHSDVVTTPGLSRNEVLAHPKTLKHALGITDPALTAKIKPEMFTNETVLGGASILVPRPVFRTIARHEAPKEFRKAFFDRVETELGFEYEDSSLKPYLSQSEFLNTPFMGALTRHLINSAAPELNVTLSERGPIRPGMSETEFTNEVLIPAAWGRADEAFNNLPAPGATLEHSNPEHTAPFRALYVPALALTFSLILSLLTLGKVANRVTMLVLVSRHPGERIGITRFIPVATVLVILVSLPLVFGSNRLAETKIIEAATGQETLQGLPAKVLRWTLEVEPLIFPIGNYATQAFRLPELNLAQYYDSNTVNRDARQAQQTVKALEIKPALSVEDLQRTLSRKGYNPGPVDGIFGTGTMNALRDFQIDQGLEASGTQTRETIKALRQ